MNSHKHRRGAAAVGMVLAMVASSLVMVGLVLGGAREQDLTVHRMTGIRNFYAAEAGMNMAIREAVNNQDFDGDGTIGGITSTASSRNVLSGAQHDVSATKSGDTFSLVCESSLSAARAQLESEVTLASTAMFAKGASINSDIEMSNSARIDAFDSSTGTYIPGTNSNEKASVATNSSSNGGVKMSNTALINGDVETGVGSNPNTVVNTSGSATVTGSKSALDEALAHDSITAPSPLPASSGNLNLSANTTTSWNEGTYHYNNVSISNSHIRNVNGDVVIYCDETFSLSNTAKVRLDSGATLTVYAKHFSFSNNTEMNYPVSPDVPTPGNVTLYHYGSGDYEQSNASIVIAAVIAPNAKVDLDNSTRLFGVIQAKTLKMANTARFTQDLALASGGGGSSGGGSNANVASWAQVPP